MRIAYHNPWINSSENQAYMSMAEAASRIGIALVACRDEIEIEACQPDFVIAVASSLPKVTDYPTYVNVHEPKAYLFDMPGRLNNLLSFDGYLTISDRLDRFIRDLCFAVGRVEEPGFFYLTPQVSALRSDWEHADRAETLRVAYFGTNWNRRMPLLFRALDDSGILRVHGPEASWLPERLRSYAGPVAFDGVGPQRIYAECGIGLALMDERWQREDIISNRIFEVSSVGAVSICPDMPWTRRWFGDSVLYYDQAKPMWEIAEAIRRHHAFCRADPKAAAAMAETARGVFEAHFTAERLLANAVTYHARKTAAAPGRRARVGESADITVILRCGGRPLVTLRRALDSIRRQSFGRFTVILAKYRSIDLDAIRAEPMGAVAGYDEFLIEGGQRTEMLFAALRRIRTPWFAVLDDDDFWLHDHMEELFRAGRQASPDFDMAFSGVVDFDRPVAYTETLSTNRSLGRFGFGPALADGLDLQNAIGINAFVARTDLLPPDLLETPPMRTAEDSLLICLLGRRSKPVFSYRATAFYRQDAPDGSGWRTDPERTEDEITLGLRAGLAWSPRWLQGGSFGLLHRIWASARARIGRTVLGEHLDRLTVGAVGWRVTQGITTAADSVGHLCHGPYIRLPGGRYIAVFLVVPDANAPGDLLGEVSVQAMPPGRRFASAPVRRDSDVIILPFSVVPDMADWGFEFPVSSRGRGSFTLASVALYRDTGKTPDAFGGSRRDAAPHSGEEARIAALEHELAMLRGSTSWRMTAPFRAIMRLVRGQ